MALAAAALVAASLAPARGEERDLAALREVFRRPEQTATVVAPEEEARARLGRHLFFERLLSGTGRMACSTCHDPARLFQDDRPRAVGVFYRALARRTPSLFDLANVRPLMRDGRAPDLEAQVLMPILDPDEMGQTAKRLLAQLGQVSFYREAFAQIFPERGLTLDTLAQALASYVRTLESPRTAFDAWVEGDEAALEPEAQRGLALFAGKAGCVACHFGWRLSDDRFHDIGLPTNDLGRGRFDPDPSSRFAFRTPSLRWVGKRPPYMHDGSLADLRAVIEHYDRGGIARPSRSPLVRPLGLTPEEKAQLLAFLASLSRPPPAEREVVRK